MTALGIGILIVCVVAAAFQVVCGRRLIATFQRPAPSLLENDECPNVVMVLCLRGTDPFLPTTLRRLLTQDYPNYQVRVVIDAVDDPAGPIVDEAIRETGARHVDVMSLDHHDPHCAARSSSILKGTDNLPTDCRLVVMCDGDVVLHPSCLRELVSSLLCSDAQAATGIRWFAPKASNIGSIVRLQWSLECNIMMHAMRLPWAGCLAMYREVVEDPEFRRRLALAFGDDMLLGSLLQQRGEKLVFVPQATIVNREVISLKGLLTFLTRHMLYVRLNHHRWKLIFGFSTSLVILAAVVCPLGLLHWALRPWCAAGLALLATCMVATMIGVGRAARRIVAIRGEQLIAMMPMVIAKMLAAVPITQLVSLYANVAACTTRQTTWRGLTYRFGRDPQVTLIREVPVAQVQQHNVAAVEAAAE